MIRLDEYSSKTRLTLIRRPEDPKDETEKCLKR
jgi:hypothetical protein